jgi:CheY-like chemotaxis protein
MPFDVFFCHSSKDQRAAAALCAGFEAAGLRCWIAPRDITASLTWAAAIAEGIAASRVVVVLLSSHSNGSKQVLHEVNLADSKGKPLFSVRLEDLALSGQLEYYLGSQHWLDGFPPPIEQHAPKFLEHICRLAGRAPPPSPGADRPATPTVPVHGRQTVLLIDDDETVRAMAKSELAKDGFAALTAGDGSQALGLLQGLARPPDLVILDIDMPVMDGITFLHHFRADTRWARTPVVVLTAKSAAGWKAAVGGLGADAFLNKPFLPKELRACVRGFLNSGRQP